MRKFCNIRRVILVGLLMVLPLGLAAQDVPGLFDVTGVAQDDVLNIRARPDAGADKLGALGPNQQSVEVVALSQNNKWGLVNTGDRSGWASMRYLQASGFDIAEPPFGFSCSGTEPFWGLTFGNDGTATADWSPMGLTGPDTSVYMSFWSARSQNRTSPVYGFRLADEVTGSGVHASGVITAGLCSDNMSDRAYGYMIDMLLRGPENAMVSGCCSLSRE